MSDLQNPVPDFETMRIAVSVEAFTVCLQAASQGEIKAPQILETLQEVDPDRNFNKNIMLLAARKLGFRARAFRSRSSRLRLLPTPFLIQMENGEYLVIFNVDSKHISIFNPASKSIAKIDIENFNTRSTGRGLIFAWGHKEKLEEYLFGWKWFLKSLYRYRVPLRAVIIFSFFLQLAQFITPIFFQVVVDKVIVHRAPSTLDVLALGLGAIYLFEVILSLLRGYIFPHTTNRIDVELGTRVFSHLLKLPIKYFDDRRVGDTIARVYEVENIRNFITGTTLTLVVDSFFAVALIITLFVYSTILGWIVVGTLPLYVILSVSFTPYLKSLIDEKFNKGAHRQSFLVEMVSGIGTVKSMAVENQIKNKWDHLLANFVTISFSVTRVSNFLEQSSQFISRAVLLAVLYFGAREVMAGRLTVGELMAFNMLVQQLTQPILKLVSSWQQFQQASISINRIGDILNAETEIKTNAKSVIAPELNGDITFQNVSFKYRPDRDYVIKNIDLDIKAGEVIGIVGTSGSGKSTLTKLLQLLYKPNEGRILIDNLDISLLQPSTLRRQIGVVLQENVLFNATVAENIAFGHPEIDLPKIVEAAQLAGAHEFILELPQGYNTEIGERGASLSGGQRQRIAIARALINNPPILIFDEATSALDYETEKKIQDNMIKICENRTVIIIAHRLSTVRHADRIIVFEHGKIHEIGSHDELIALNGRYAELYSIQAS